MRYAVLILLSLLCTTTHAQIITTVVGGGAGGGTDGYGSGLPATNATLGNFAGIAIDSYGNLYIADKDRQIIRKVDALTSVITTVVGTGVGGFSGDGGPATNAQINSPGWVAFDSHGNLVFTDRANHRLRRVNSLGIIETIAGIGTVGFSGDGFAATSAQLSAPQSLCIDSGDNIYITDNGNSRIRRVNVAGIIETIAGVGAAGFSGDGGPATAAGLEGILGIHLDGSSSLYVCEWLGHRVRKINLTSGIISTFAGNSASPYTADGVPATTSGVDPFDVSVDDVGNVYIADLVNNRVRKVDTFGVIHTIVGDGVAGYSGDGGAATAASLNRPAGVTLDKCGNLYIADNQNYRVRKVTFNPYTTPTITVTSTSTAAVGATVTVNAVVSGAGSGYSIKWYRNSVLFSTTTVPVTTYTKGAGTDTITARVLPAYTYCYDSATAAPCFVSESVSVPEPRLLQGVTITPNPARDRLYLSAAAVIHTITITNLLGQTLHQQQNTTTTATADISTLPPGTYLLHLNETYVRRFVKE